MVSRGGRGVAIANCRVCGRRLFEKPLIRFENMPRAAQFLPDASSVATETGIDLGVRQCTGCGLVQLENDPVPYHKKVVRAAAFSEEMGAFRFEQFERFARRFSLHGKKIIEIGCGRGEYLSILRGCGLDAHGLEESAESVACCLDLGLKAFQGYFESCDDRHEQCPFDAFCIFNFIEHLPDPNSTLGAIIGNLKEGGVGIVEAPNFDMILRNEFFSEFIPDHLFYFTKETLSATLRLNGFEVLECSEIWHNYILSAIVAKRRTLDLSHFHRRRERLKSEILDFLAGFGAKRVAVWGAGHQALAVLALTGISGRIRYVLDSAPFKQGRFTPATHIPVVAPETLLSDPVDAVIVMAASYSDEVVRTIRSRFDRGIRVAVLRDHGLDIEVTP